AMLHLLVRGGRAAALCSLFVVYAQDASLALRTSVGYRTQRATLNLTEEQRKRADELSTAAQQAAAAGKYGDALRDYAEGTAVMRNVPWTANYEFATGLQGKLSHALLEPGKEFDLTVAPLFTSTRPGEVKMTAAVFFVPAKKDAGGEQSLASNVAVAPGAVPLTVHLKAPAGAAGDYAIEVRLTPAGEEPPAAAHAAFVKSLPVHVESLAAQAQLLRERLAKIGNKGSTAASAEYALTLYDLADRGEVSPHRYHLADEIARAGALLDELEAGRDPLAKMHGDARKAYRSAVDHTLQPYRLFIPEAYNGTKTVPLVVALHGMGGDENSIFDQYANGVMKREAERLGFAVVCPKGRDSASMYRGTAEQDVLDVLAEVRRDYRIDPARIYLMGHSMGAYGTWSVAMAHPEIFAALGPISGGGDTAGMVKIKDIPQYVVHGDDDRTVPVTQSRRMVEAGKAAGARIEYVEVKGGSHVSVAAPAFAPMLDFFAKQAKGGGETTGAVQHLPRGTATDVTNDDIQATLKKTATAAVSDQAIRVVSVNDEYNVGVGVVHRARTNGPQAANGIEHSQITEVYHVIEGNGTLVTGGTIENPRETPATSQVVRVLNGPSTGGGAIVGGVSRKVGPGDVVIIPPNTPHWFSEISSEQIVYLVIRVDPKKVLPAGYGAK
ncbi:MAG TPA: PHB depolymerase family esterase, partial [Bryobacteraceae bacterium]